MVAVRQKPAAALAFKRGGRGKVVTLPQRTGDPPAPPEWAGAYAVQVWLDFFATDVSGAVNMRRDGERLRHWLWSVQKREVIERRLEEEPEAVGSQGQVVAHPLWQVWAKLNLEIERAEAHFGMTPLAKMRLTGALDQAEAAEESIKARRQGRRPTLLPAKKVP